MKKIFLSISAILAGIALFSSCDDKQIKADTYIDSFSYAQGLIGGTGYRTILDSVKIRGEIGNKDLFYEAFRAGFNNDSTKFLMTREEAFDIIRKEEIETKRKAQEERERRFNEEAAFNKIKADEFLKKYKEEKNVVAMENGVLYKVIKTGYGPKPTLQDTVVIHYVGKLADGNEFVNSYTKKAPLKFSLNTVTIPGIKSVLQEMPRNSIWEIAIPPEMAYGKEGTTISSFTVPSNSVLIFKIELLKVFNPK